LEKTVPIRGKYTGENQMGGRKSVQILLKKKVFPSSLKSGQFQEKRLKVAGEELAVVRDS